MEIAVLGTGQVGQTIAAKLDDLGHRVTIGTRDPEHTMSRTDTDGRGRPPFREWADAHRNVAVATLAEAAAGAVIVINATNGAGSLEALEAAGEENLAGKVLIDVANPLDFTGEMPPGLFVSNTDSLAERIQRRFPEAKVVKTLNTVNTSIMVEPDQLGAGNHTVFLSGNDPDAKTKVRGLLESFGWSDVVDLGDVSTARGPEMYMPLWLRILRVNQSPVFNVKVVR